MQIVISTDNLSRILIALKMAKNEMDAVNSKRGITTPAQESVNDAIKIMEGK